MAAEIHKLILPDFGRDAMLSQRPVTPRAQNTLRELVKGALAINRISLERLPTPAELLLQQQWLQQAQQILENSRYGR